VADGHPVRRNSGGRDALRASSHWARGNGCSGRPGGLHHRDREMETERQEADGRQDPLSSAMGEGKSESEREGRRDARRQRGRCWNSSSNEVTAAAEKREHRETAGEGDSQCSKVDLSRAD
jgi:hypothetical protein